MTTRNTITRAAAVLRTSTAGQKHAEGEDSIDKQRAAAEEWAAAEGWELVTIYDETADTGYQSGVAALNDRPYIQAMLIAADRGEFDTVIFFAPDRLGRKKTHAMRMLADLEDAGVSVSFSKNRKVYDASDIGDSIMLIIGQVFAEADYKDIIEKMAVGKYQRAKIGEWSYGSHPPTGYVLDRNTKRLVVDPDEARLVKRVFEVMAEGAGTTEAAQKLSHEFKLVRDNGVSESLIKKIIRRTSYVGGGITRSLAPTHGGEKEEIVSHAGEDFRLVSDELWNAGNEGLTARKGKPRTASRMGQKPYRAYGLGKGRVRHLQIGYGDAGSYQMNGAARVYRHPDGTVKDQFRVYHCDASRSRRGRFGREDVNRCQGFAEGSGAGRRTAYGADLLEARVLLVAIEALSDPEKLSEIRQAYREKVFADAGIDIAVTIDPQEQIEAIEETLADIVDRADRIREEWRDGDISKERRDELLASDVEKIAGLERQRTSLAGVRQSEEHWQNMLVHVAAEGPFGTFTTETGDSFGWEDVAEMVTAEAQSVVDGETRFLSIEAIELCADLAELLDMIVTITDKADGTVEPFITVEGNLPNGTTDRSGDHVQGSQFIWTVAA